MLTRRAGSDEGPLRYSGQNVSRTSGRCDRGPSRQDGHLGRTWRAGHRDVDGRTRGERRRPVDNADDPGSQSGRGRSEGHSAPPALPSPAGAEAQPLGSGSCRGGDGRPDLQRGDQPRPRSSRGCAPRSPTSTSWSSTTAPRTAPARSPTSSPLADAQVHVLHRTREGGARQGLPGRLRVGPRAATTTSSARWTPTGPTSPSSSACSSRRLDEPADLVIGSRWVRGGSIVNWPLRRELLSRGGNLYTRVAARHPRPRRHRGLPPVPAYDAGADRAGHHRVLRLRLPGRPRRAARCRAGLRVVEVPIEFVERERGESKMNAEVATESLRRITAGGSASAAARLRGLFRRRGPEPSGSRGR